MKFLKIVSSVLITTTLCLCNLTFGANLQWSILARQEFAATPLDVALSPSDGRMFVLLEGGEIQILAPNGQLQNSFKIPGANSLTISPDGQRLLISNQQSKELQIVEITYLHVLPVGNSPIKGAANAPVTLTVFDDFQCPYCARLVPVLDQVLATYPGQVRIVFKHFPLRMHAFAQTAAMASIAAREQGKFWEMYDHLFANFKQLDEEKIKSLAKQIGLNMARFEEDMNNATLAGEVNRDLLLGQQVGVRGTPTIFLNGKLVKNRNLGELRLLIDQELAKIKRQ